MRLQGQCLLATPPDLVTELREFATAVLSGAAGPDRARVAWHVLSTPVSEAASLTAMIQRAVDNPLNAGTPLVHVAGPPGASGPPVFMAHGADGEVGWFLRHLAGLRLARPVYGITAPGWYGEEMPESVAELAARHIREIRRLQPAGPYTLGGYSSGGQLALEMAAQLESAGESIHGLLLVDPALGYGSLTASDVICLRLNQVRQRLNPRNAPFFDLADALDPDRVLKTIAGGLLPAEPVARRFYRGLCVLMGVLGAQAPLLWPVTPARTVILRTQGAEDAAENGDKQLEMLTSVICGPCATRTVPASHSRLFEHADVQESIAEFIGGLPVTGP